MNPGYFDGDFVVTLKWPQTRYLCHDVIVAKHPIYQTIIKRIAKLDDDSRVLLTGDNPTSTSSKQLGWLPQSSLKGKVVWRITRNK